MFIMKRALFLVLILPLLFGGVFGVSAQTGACQDYCSQLNAGVENPPSPPGITCICNPLQTTNFTDIVNSILTLLFNFALVVAPLMIVVAGILFVTAGGNPAQITRARQILIWTFVGFALILLARGLIAIIRELIGF